jgi:hypothetical protein
VSPSIKKVKCPTPGERDIRNYNVITFSSY